VFAEQVLADSRRVISKELPTPKRKPFCQQFANARAFFDDAAATIQSCSRLMARI